MDGATYEFQSSGEFIASRSTAGDLEVQLRLESTGFSSYVSIATAVAVLVDTTRASVVLGREPMLFVDEQPTDLDPDGSLELPDGGRIERSKRGLRDLLEPTGRSCRIKVRKSHINVFLRPFRDPSKHALGPVRQLQRQPPGRRRGNGGRSRHGLRLAGQLPRGLGEHRCGVFLLDDPDNRSIRDPGGLALRVQAGADHVDLSASPPPTKRSHLSLPDRLAAGRQAQEGRARTPASPIPTCWRLVSSMSATRVTRASPTLRWPCRSETLTTGTRWWRSEPTRVCNPRRDPDLIRVQGIQAMRRVAPGYAATAAPRMPIARLSVPASYIKAMRTSSTPRPGVT